MSIKVSVIIPVYNAEKYLTECIQSLVKQSLTECEFIFINDGSIDNSERIINEFKNKDSRIKIINQLNKGVSAARNAGLRVALGEYIGFVDADDFIEIDMYEQLYQTANRDNCDVVLCNYESEIEGRKLITKYPFPINNTLEKDFINKTLLSYFFKEDNLNSVCNKIFRNEIIKKNNIIFHENVDLGEDGLFNIAFISKANTLVYIDYTGYHYREVIGSATRNILKKNYFKRSLSVYKSEIPKELLNNIDKEEVQKLKSIKLIKSTMAYIHIYFKPTKEIQFRKRYKYIKNMINNQFVQESLLHFQRYFYEKSNNYEKVILNLMKYRLTLALYLVTAYSRARNKL